MFRRTGNRQGRIRQIVEAFRAKGATSPEKAMTSKDLGLLPRFDEAMERRLGQTGIFVRVGDRYYLSEERLREVRERLKERYDDLA